MQTETYDVIVIGLGVMGTATAFELQSRGLNVLGLEQYVENHEFGSSHGSTRVIRKAYYEHPSYVPLLQRAYDRWYRMEQLCGWPLLIECGVLSLGKADSELIRGVHRSAAEHALPLQSLSADELRRLYPQFTLPEDVVGAFEPSGGYLKVELSVMVFSSEAKALGATMMLKEKVLSWEATPTGVVVHTENNRFEAPKLVIAGGAWAGQLLHSLQLPLIPRRVVQLWFQSGQPELLRRDRFPIYIADMPEAIFYGFPVTDKAGHKCALHQPGEVVDDPSRLDKQWHPSDEAPLRELLARYLPVALGPVSRGRPCMYTMTPDQHFVLDLHPAYPQVAIAAGFSGHGFKFAPVVGEIMADFVEHGRSELPVQMFGIKRFEQLKK